MVSVGTDTLLLSPQGGYVPPSVRNRGAAGMGDSMHRREENSVRVTNLSEDTREEDLRVSSGCRIIVNSAWGLGPCAGYLASGVFVDSCKTN